MDCLFIDSIIHADVDKKIIHDKCASLHTHPVARVSSESFRTLLRGSVDSVVVLARSSTAETEDIVMECADEDESEQPAKRRRNNISAMKAEEVDRRLMLRFAPVTDGLASDGHKESLLPSTWGDPRLILGPIKARDDWNFYNMEGLERIVGEQLLRINEYLLRRCPVAPRFRRYQEEQVYLLAAVLAICDPQVKDRY